MALIKTSKLFPSQLTGETGSFALASDGSKTLHVVTKFYYDDDEYEITEAYTEFQITHRQSLESYSSFEMAVERYNEL